MNEPQENWRPIDRTGGVYECSDIGRIRRDGRVLKARINHKGYLDFTPRVNGAKGFAFIHAVVAETFIGPRPDGAQINHRNGNKTDNRPSNLEYVTASENVLHAYANRLKSNEGEKHPSHKLTEDDVRAIRALASEMTGVQLSKRYPVKPAQISSIINRKSWRHVA